MLLDTHIKLLLVDLNGTMVDDWLAGGAGAAAVFAGYNKPCPSLTEFVEHVAEHSYPSFYETHGVKDATVDDLHRLFLPGYRSAIELAQVTPGMLTVLQQVRALGVEIRLVTMGRHDFVDMILDHFELREQFDDMHVHIVEKDKLIQQVIQEKGLKPKQCIHVGDMPKDAKYAHKAGVHNIILQNRHVHAHLFTGVPMDLYATSIYELLTYIKAR